jgi:hypothetical protein
VEDGLVSLKNPRRKIAGSGFDTRDAFGSSSGSRSKGSRRRRRTVISVLIICAVVAVLVAADFWANQGRIYQGVMVGNVSLGGKTPGEARDRVYLALVKWIDDSGYRMAGHSRELYLEWHDDDHSRNVTELQMPIAR